MNYQVTTKGASILQYLWQSSGALPQSVTIDLGQVFSNIDMATYVPRQDHLGYWTSNVITNYTTTGNIMGYNLHQYG